MNKSGSIIPNIIILPVAATKGGGRGRAIVILKVPISLMPHVSYGVDSLLCLLVASEQFHSAK